MQLPVLDKSVFTVQSSLSSEDACRLQIACFLCFDSCCFANCTPQEIWKNSFQRRNLSVLRGWASIICSGTSAVFSHQFFWGAVFHPGPRAADNACNSVSAAGLTLRGRSFFAAGSHLQASSASVDEAFFLFWRRVGTALPSPVSVV